MRSCVAEPAQPFADERESSLIHGIHANPAALLELHETGVLQDAQVPRRRRPLVRKPPCDLAGGRCTTEVDRQKDLPPRRVRQRGDDGIERR